jgi:restriction endonuclease S subunit
LTAKDKEEVFTPFVYHYLQAHKDELLVPLMRGSANVSLNEERLKKLKIPLPSIEKQKNLVRDILQVEKNISNLKRLLVAANEEFDAAATTLKASF